MKLTPIFVDANTGEGLYAIKYVEEGLDEFERLFDLWNDTQFIHTYCVKNQSYLEAEYFTNISIDEVESKILDEAAEFEQLLEEYVKEGFEQKGRNLQMLFKPLNNNEHLLPVHQEGKAKVDDTKNFPRPILRIYGVRLGVNTFVITGGAIKLTKLMRDHPDTELELEKLKQVKAFLKANGINVEEDLNYYYEQSEK